MLNRPITVRITIVHIIMLYQGNGHPQIMIVQIRVLSHLWHTHKRVQIEEMHVKKARSGAIDVKKLNKDEILTSVAVVILLFTVMINWNIYSWLVLLAIIVILTAWYFRS